MARASTLLQDGNRVVDIAILYPIESLEGWYEWDNPTRPTIGKDVTPVTDNYQIGEFLTGTIKG